MRGNSDLDDIEWAAKRVIVRWNSPVWKEPEHTGELIRELETQIVKLRALKEAVPDGLGKSLYPKDRFAVPETQTEIWRQAAKLLNDFVGGE